MADRLSDEELRKSLQDFGESVGPITNTTRSLWEKRLNILRKKYGVSSADSGVNFLSSDDSEIENTDINKAKKKRTPRNSISPVVYLKKRNLTSSPRPDIDVFKKPSPLHNIPGFDKSSAFGSRVSLNKNQNAKIKSSQKSHNSTFEIETSDSDLDYGNSLTPRKSFKHRKKTSQFNSNDNIISQYQHGGTNSSLTMPLDSKWTSIFKDDCYKRKEDKYSLQGKKSFDTNGYLSNSLSNGEFHGEEKVQGSSTNYSHCVSWMLVLGMVAFFIVIGVLYMSKVQKNQISIKNYSSKICNGLEKEPCKSVIKMSRELHNLLSQVAGEYDCGSALIKTRNLTLLDAKKILMTNFQSKAEDFDTIFNNTIQLIKKNPEWGIKWYSLSESNSNIHDESALEAIHAAKSLWCRVRLSIQWTALKFLYILMLIALLCLSYFIAKLWKHKKEAEERIFYELVEKVIDILQEPASSNTDSDLGPCRPVVQVRDALIPAKERKEKQWLWDKVVAFIEKNESRVSVEYKKIAGEDFKMWRWHPCTSIEGEGGKLGKVWQGQAFNNLGKGKNASYCPTPCLKIRNMFDPEIEYGNDWQINIRDAILEKCEENDGIVHIAIDTSTSEGCVYLLCSSPQAAGKAFNALHGWWFDGKLVTVKYIRYERYLERFPEAADCTEPLKPSNNKRLSLSTPFFSSALERS